MTGCRMPASPEFLASLLPKGCIACSFTAEIAAEVASLTENVRLVPLPRLSAHSVHLPTHLPRMPRMYGCGREMWNTSLSLLISDSMLSYGGAILGAERSNVSFFRSWTLPPPVVQLEHARTAAVLTMTYLEAAAAGHQHSLILVAVAAHRTALLTSCLMLSMKFETTSVASCC